MSPCVVLASSAVGSPPLSHLQPFGANALFLAAFGSIKGRTCQSAPVEQNTETWLLSLQELSRSPLVTTGSVSELAVYRDWVKSKIQAAAELASTEADRDSGVFQKLQRAMALVDSGLVNKGREVACELLGFSQLKSLATSSLQLTWAASLGSSSSSTCSSSSAVGGTPQFKVPALPAKRNRTQLEQAQPSESAQHPATQQHSHTAQHQQRKHSAPKRRATPQVLPAAPFVLSGAAPDSTAHGESCCDETLLSCWCPISGKRQHTLPVEPKADAASSDLAAKASSNTSGNSSEQLPRQSSPPSSSATSAAGTATVPKAAVPAAAGGLSAAAAVQANASVSRAASHAEAVDSLKRLLHEDPSHSKPSSDVLLFKKAHQQPIHNWTGTIKHRSNGRVVELCKVTLQVPEPFLEEFPAALYAAEVRHRRSVSLGRHVVCRATLGTVSEHQLAGLSAMARGQLVALCALQTAELHLVPYFDNKNLVRMVGFLKIKAE